MKLDALGHPKTLNLQALLEVDLPTVIGHLGLLWAFTGKHAAVNFHCAPRVAPEKAVFRPALVRHSVAGSSPEKTMTSYADRLRDPRWQRRRLEDIDALGEDAPLRAPDER